MKSSFNFPPEIWIIIIEQLASEFFIRKADTLIKVLKININIDKYRLLSLREYRKNYRGIPDEEWSFWDQTGIDDGLPDDILLQELNENTRSYRTVYSKNIEQCDNNICILGYGENPRSIGVKIKGEEWEDLHVVSLIKDIRPTPNTNTVSGLLKFYCMNRICLMDFKCCYTGINIETRIKQLESLMIKFE